MKLSIAICTHNEGQYVGNLLGKLTQFISYAERITTNNFEIVVVDDNSTDKDTVEFLHAYEFGFPGIVRHFKHSLNRNFAEHKNFMNSMCSGDWILNLDADETINDDFLFNIPEFIEANPDIEAYWLPRVNTVNGLTLKHVQKWGWIITTLPGFRNVAPIPSDTPQYELLKAHNLIISEENGYVTYNEPIIQWHDPQMRLYRNKPEIRWERAVHERLVGYAGFSQFPAEVDYAIIHRKEIDRQEAQNSLYDTFDREEQLGK